MSYTIDVFRGKLKASHNPLDYMLYVAFFPHLVAGPIVRASFLLPQCQHARTIKPNEVINGIWQILMGYIKKVVIADRLADIVTWGFSHQSPPFADANAWVIIYAFAFQIYRRLFRLFRHRTRPFQAHGLRTCDQFSRALSGHEPFCVLAKLAHQSVHMAPRLSLHSVRRQSSRAVANLRELDDDNALSAVCGMARVPHFLLWGLYHGLLLSIHRAWQSVTERWSNRRPREVAAKQARTRLRFCVEILFTGVAFLSPDLLWLAVVPGRLGITTA